MPQRWGKLLCTRRFDSTAPFPTVVLAGLLAPRTARCPDLRRDDHGPDCSRCRRHLPGASCSLRTAIAQANADPDCTRIEFDFTPAFGGYIALVSPLPAITSPVEIDGWSHPNSTRFPDNGASPGPVLRVGIRGDTNNIAGSGLRFLDPGYGLVQGIAVSGFSTGAGIEVAASTSADQNVTIRENILGRWWQTDVYPTNRVGVSVQARGVHVGGGRTTNPNDPQGPVYFLDNSRGNYFRATTGPAIHVTTSPFGIQGRARIIGNHFDDYFFASPLLVDLGPEGPTPNDPGDPDAGPNDLQNKPEMLFEPMRFPPEEGDPPGPSCTAANNYEDCDGVRVTVRLAGAPAGTYTAELLAGNVDPFFGDNPGIHPFLLTGAMTRTGSGDPDFVFEIATGSSSSAACSPGSARAARSRSRPSAPSSRRAASTRSTGRRPNGPGWRHESAAAADLHALFRRRRRRLVLRHDVLALELRLDAATATMTSIRTPVRR